MQDAFAVIARQSIDHGALVGQEGSFFNKTPIMFVKAERFFSGDRVGWIAIPCDQSKLGEITNDEGVGRCIHGLIMHDDSAMFKRMGNSLSILQFGTFIHPILAFWQSRGVTLRFAKTATLPYSKISLPSIPVAQHNGTNRASKSNFKKLR